MTSVLDASALLAFYKREPGAEVVLRLVPTAVISSVNVVEVVGKLIDLGVLTDDATRFVAEMFAVIHPFDAAMAAEAGALRPIARRAGLSLGDACCIALAKALAAPVYTADRAWAGLDLGVEVRLIR